MSREAVEPPADGASPVPELYRPQRRHILAFLLMSFTMFGVGGLYGVLQAFDKMGVNLYQYLPPVLRSYYMGLTVHGVSLALLFTTFFIIGFLTLTIVHGLRRPLASRGLVWLTFWLAVVGLVLTMTPVFLNEASVLWTFYAPLKAHPAFYVGLALVALSTWTAALNAYLTWRSWKRDHPGERTPLMAFVTLATWVMWVLASLGLAVSLVTQLIPWSAGVVPNVNPLLTRSLYWFTGHPIVYFWLLPAYVSWYTMLPKQVEGKLFSESLARLVFLLFLPLAIPTGFHHMYADPGVSRTVKLAHAVITYGVIFPSLLTAFTVLASIEYGAGRRGGRGWLGWLLALPWLSNPSATGQLLGMLIFATGGITGLINASFTMNMVIHNTMWVPGHLHTQVAGAVTLTYMAVSYWLVPLLTGKALWGRKWAVLQVWTWFFGLAVMARGMHWQGLSGVPRRSFLSQAPYADFAEWHIAGWLTGAGGLLLLVAGGLFLWIMIRTAWFPAAPARVQVPEAEPLHEVARMPLVLDRITPWVLVTVVLVAAVWLPSLYRIATTYPVTRWRLW